MNKIMWKWVVLASLIFSNRLCANAAVYEITQGKNKVYLAGTIHLLRPQDFPIPNEFNEAYKRSQKIYFETDMEKAKAPAFGQRFAQAMILPNNQTLKDVLNAQNWAALQAYATKSPISA